MASFFELRHRVWKEMGYLSPEKECPQVPWELDYTDRTSLPLGIFSKADGRLLGAARLVRGFGEDDPRQIRIIEDMLRLRNAANLVRNFRYPDSVAHPFDILGELDKFKEYYRNLVLRGISKAEVSRVVVDPDYRKLGFGEVIVDTVCSLARSHGIPGLFLACHRRHAAFYERSGFSPIQGVAGQSS
ncbi:MAG: GNAT family N-acetyltransferase [Pirellulales bacterium]